MLEQGLSCNPRPPIHARSRAILTLTLALPLHVRSSQVIVSALRTPIGKAGKAFGQTTPDTLLKQLFEGMLSQTGVNPGEMGEVTVGNVQLAGSYAGGARQAQLEAGFPFTVPVHSVNRQCSSGLQAVASVASAM